MNRDNAEHTDWNAEMDQSWYGSEYTTVLRISATRGDQTESYGLDIASAIKIYELDSTSQIESVADDIADRFDSPIPMPEGAVGERFWSNVQLIAEQWVASEMAEIGPEFTEACLNDNTIPELEEALAEGPDAADMRTWGITAETWTRSIKTALAEMRSRAQEGENS